MAKNEQGDEFREATQNLFEGLRDIFKRSAEEVVAGAKMTKTRIDIYQLRRDRDHFLMRLGEVAYDLLDEGAIRHPELEQPYRRVRAIEDKITDYERGITEAEPAKAEPPADKPLEKEPAKAAPKKKAPAKKKPAAEPKPDSAKAEPDPAKKPAAKKAAPKKTTAKKAAPKKPAARKPAAKKPATATADRKKPAAKKSTKKTGTSNKKAL